MKINDILLTDEQFNLCVICRAIEADHQDEITKLEESQEIAVYLITFSPTLLSL